MHARFLVVMGLLLVIFLGGIFWLFPTGQQDQPSSADQPTSYASPTAATATVPVSDAPGLPAIVPHLPSPPLGPGAANEARFTSADVQAYLRTHPFPSGPLVAGARPRPLWESTSFPVSRPANACMERRSECLIRPRSVM